MNFEVGNVGYKLSNSTHWARCVRDTIAGPSNMVVTDGSNQFPEIHFYRGLPNNAYTSGSKTPLSLHNESDILNQQVYRRLIVAKNDLNGGALTPWTINLCSSFSESGITSGWRLPTQRELYAIWILQDEMKNVHTPFNILDANEYYWSGTSASPPLTNFVWTIWGGKNMSVGAGNAPSRDIGTSSNPTRLRVRCVREN